ncbi:hypothetical protein [Hydrogenovibrio halophilus]|uniref:hypothetical protein n=1 Tax=Hydrogenovibrio halophilus TaxID=373391 RepID=UPI00037D3A27|nr:hypothetical protein [Hydrogenovibrio halophilus]
MPLPLLIGPAVAAGIYGAKKGYDAKKDYDLAKIYNREAEEIYEEAQESLNFTREHANEALENLGEIKYKLATADYVDFHKTWDQLTKNYPDLLNEYLSGERDKNSGQLEKEFFGAVETSRLESSELVSGGFAALGSGGVAGLAAYGGVGMLGTASTGTAIGSLSGAAATNATLAWLGGGSLASGGLGMAGGAAVLGGVVAGPVLAIGGAVMASKAEESKERAKENVAKAKVAAKEMKVAEVTTNSIKKSCDLTQKTLVDLSEVLEAQVKNVNTLISHNVDLDALRPYAMIMLAAFESSFSIYITKALTDEGTSNPQLEKTVEKQVGKFNDKFEEIEPQIL